MNRYNFSKNTFNKNRFVGEYIIWLEGGELIVHKFKAIDNARQKIMDEAARYGENYEVVILPIEDRYRLGLRAIFRRKHHEQI